MLPANYVHATFHALNHMFAYETPLPLVVPFQQVQLCIYITQLRSVVLKRHVYVWRNLTLDTKQAVEFLTFFYCCWGWRRMWWGWKGKRSLRVPIRWNPRYTLNCINQIKLHIYMRYSLKISKLSWMHNKLVEGISQPQTKLGTYF